MPEYLRPALLLFLLLNPFLMVVYLIDLFEKVPRELFDRIMLRASAISIGVFVAFAVLGDVIFRELLQARFASFQVFGGLVFLIIGLRFVFEGNATVGALRGEGAHIAGAIAMPVMIGPGTIGASVVAGQRLGPLMATLIIVVVVLTSSLTIIALRRLHDWVRPRNEPLVQRYIEATGRITALVVGTFAVEMILAGLTAWWQTG